MVQSGYVMKYLPVPPNCLYIPEFTDGQSIMSYVSLLVNLPGKLVLPTDLIVWCPIRFVSGYFNSFVEEGASKDRADKKIKIWFPKLRVTWRWIMWTTTCYWKIHPSKGHYKGMWQDLDVDDLWQTKSKSVEHLELHKTLQLCSTFLCWSIFSAACIYFWSTF